MDTFKLEPSNPETTGRPEWQVRVNGELLPDAEHIECNSQYGRLQWGKRPEGFTGWAWQEAGGGGVITLPYTYTPQDELLVALVQENRMNMGQLQWCGIGGFVKPDQTHADAQVEEAAEEVNFDSSKAPQLGIPQNSNRLYFVGNPLQDEGVHNYALEVPFELLDEHMQLPGAPGKLGKAVFHEWRKAILELCGDTLATSAVGQLVARESLKGRLR